MSLSADLVIGVSLAYVGLLFVIAYIGDRRARSGGRSLLSSPLVYTLSISVYCTSWTFYGAVGSAARNGLEYLAIYLGPTIVFVGWWFVLRRLVRISHDQRLTSIADLLSSRFGKSNRLAVLVTVIAVIAVAPYLALQLKAITSSLQAVGTSGGGALTDDVTLAFGVAVMMAVFTILFGTRNVDAKEQHHGVVAAIAFEALVKLAALIAVGVFVLAAAGGFGQILEAAEARQVHVESSFGDRWVAIMVLSAAAVICLPRQFQITVVENSEERHLRTASWAFPAYMLAMSVFTLPIALYGLTVMPAGANPDMFTLTLPLAAGEQGLALLAFIGGFSSATSMIIVESIALSIMVSNHIVMPVIVRLSKGSQAVTGLLLNARRASILLILALGFAYFYFTRNSDALAPIGLISFAGVAQFLPAILAALFWRDASRRAAAAAIATGFVVWAWSSFLPSFASSSPLVAGLLADGPWGISWLRPEALFGLDGLDPLVHATFWSLTLNTAVLVIGSALSSQSALERLQAIRFTDMFGTASAGGELRLRGTATADDLFFVARRVLGEPRARAVFEAEGQRPGVEPDAAFIGRLERELAGSIGAASAHVMLSKVVSGSSISLEEVLRMADETQQAIEYSQRLERTSAALRATAEELEEANRRLREVDQQKDDFLSQISHEVRTPMTAIRAFSEILSDGGEVGPEEHRRFIGTIHEESLRLTRLLDEILDISALERGETSWSAAPVDPEAALDRALVVCEALARQHRVRLTIGTRAGLTSVDAEAGRLSQVFINIIANAIKYNESALPDVEVTSRSGNGSYVVEISDNGPGIPAPDRARIFDKFYRGERGTRSTETGAGLGLAISHEIVRSFGGALDLVDQPTGTRFRITLPTSGARLAASAEGEAAAS